jgi:LemA protein
LGWVVLLVFVALLLILLMYGIGTYNRLVALRERFKNGFSQIEIQLKRRYDLIPNLVETAKGYMQHERETLEAVVRARNVAVTGLERLHQGQGAGNVREFASAEAGLSQALTRFMAVAESYPDLKADRQIAELSEELTATENKVAFARQAYNDGVTEYNSYKKQFPAVLIANMSGFAEDGVLLVFEDSAQIQAAPRVSFTKP